MVVGALFEQFAPSHRGLTRNTSSDSFGDPRDFYQSNNYETRAYRDLQVDDVLDNLSERIDSHHMSVASRPATKKKRKRFRATKLLLSIAADVDVVTDWVFYFHTRAQDQEYRLELEQNPNDYAQPYLVPPWLLTSILVVCILGTTMWLVLATEGALVAPCLRWLNIDKFSMGYTLFLCVLVEDIPQVILTFFAEDYYPEDQQFNSFAMINVIASFYDTLIKLAEAFDERGDVVETGIWCKDSLQAHRKGVTDVAVVSVDVPSSVTKRSSRVHVPTQQTSASRLSVLEEVMRITSETKLPRIRLLSASADRSVRLWDTKPEEIGQSKNSLVRDIRGHSKAVTCVIYLREILDDDDLRHRYRLKLDGEGDSEDFFLSGSNDGTVKLYNLKGQCFHTYYHGPGDGAILSLASIVREKSFVSGCKDGSVWLWDISSGECIAKYEGHSKKVNSVCSLDDCKHFLSASDDNAIRLWAYKEATEEFKSKTRDFRRPSSPDSLNVVSVEPGRVEKVSTATFIGHTGAVTSIACVEAGAAFLSGSEDLSARLWSVESKVCLRIFTGHDGPITCVATVDVSTFLTGSKDKTIKVWDAFTPGALRTYSGHAEAVTSVVMAEDGAFVSSSEDKTAKLWVFTAVTPTRQIESLQEILGLNGDCVCGA